MHKAPITIPEAFIALVLFISLLGMHITYTPWLIGSEPIEAIDKYDIDNKPAPESAKSFAVNHGSAVYYEDGVPKQHPIKSIGIIVIALLLWVGILAIMYRAHRRSRNAS